MREAGWRVEFARIFGWRIDRAAERAFNRRMSEPVDPSTQPAAKKPLGNLVEKTASEVRKKPVKSVVWAFFIGIVLAVFPLGRILGAAIGLVLALLRPVLLLLGLVKLCEEIEERQK
jgi:hypothetical protein